MDEWITLDEEPLQPSAAISFVSAPALARAQNLLGGVCVFVGVTRFEKNSAGEELDALQYEAYEEMAIEQMNSLARRAGGRWPISRLSLHHRLGRAGRAKASS